MGKLELGLYDIKNRLQEPLRYSLGKTQTDLIEEILEAFSGNDIVFLKGTVGSGKSVVGLRTILEFGKGIVSVPTKVLSDQYVASYEREKYFMRADGSAAKIGILKGRGNFRCMYMADRERKISCAASILPCRRPLNKEAGERRIDALQDCSHWGFIFASGWKDSIKNAEVMPYQGIKGKWLWCMRGKCPYWKQFGGYVFSDAIVMNSAKWAAELNIGRLPEVPLTVVDEADGWLDSLAVKVSLTQKVMERVLEKIERLSGEQEELGDKGETLHDMWSGVLDGRGDPIELAGHLAGLLDEMDETSGTLYWKLRSVLEHKDHAEWEHVGKGIVFFVPDPKIVLKRILEAVGGKWLLMSATVQGEDVLKEVFGIEPTFVEGETRFPGKIIQRKLGQEETVNYRRWADDGFRRRYWDLLSKMRRRAKLPSFVPVHSLKYLPPKLREDMLRNSVDVYELGRAQFSTKMDRGADLKGRGSVIILKFPYPERGDPLLKGMERRLGPRAFWEYYRDMAEREFVQQVGRVLRSPSDVVEFWSPDETCHRKLKKVWKGVVES